MKPTTSTVPSVLSAPSAEHEVPRGSSAKFPEQPQSSYIQFSQQPQYPYSPQHFQPPYQQTQPQYIPPQQPLSYGPQIHQQPPPPVYSQSAQMNVENPPVPKVIIYFDDCCVRAAFIRKVFGMVALMLGVVAIMTSVPFFIPEIKKFVQEKLWLYLTSLGIFLTVYITLMCSETARRSSPSNLIFTAILTLSIGYMTMMITAYHNIVSVLLAVVMLTLTCFGVIIFSMQTKYNLISCMGVTVLLTMMLFVFGVVSAVSVVAWKVTVLHTVYSALAALLFTLYLAIDIQIITSEKYGISPEEYVFASIMLFMDIITIFWYLLAIFGDK